MIASAEPGGLRSDTGLVPWSDVAYVQALAYLRDDYFWWEERGRWELEALDGRWFRIGYRPWRTRELARLLGEVLPGFDPSKLRMPRARDGAVEVVWVRPGLRCRRCGALLERRPDPAWEITLGCPVDGELHHLGCRLVPIRAAPG